MILSTRQKSCRLVHIKPWRLQVDLRSSRQVDLASCSLLVNSFISLHPLLLIFIHLQLKTWSRHVHPFKSSKSQVDLSTFNLPWKLQVDLRSGRHVDLDSPSLLACILMKLASSSTHLYTSSGRKAWSSCLSNIMIILKTSRLATWRHVDLFQPAWFFSSTWSQVDLIQLGWSYAFGWFLALQVEDMSTWQLQLEHMSTWIMSTWL